MEDDAVSRFQLVKEKEMLERKQPFVFVACFKFYIPHELKVLKNKKKKRQILCFPPGSFTLTLRLTDFL